MSEARIFTILGPPFGKQRPFFKRGSRFIKPHTRSKTVKYEKRVVEEYQKLHGDKPMINGAVEVKIYAYYQITDSWSKKWTEWILQGLYLPENKPDWDNVGKIICDALNEVAYKDDSRITDGFVHKRFAIDSEPRVEVSLRQIFDDPKV